MYKIEILKKFIQDNKLEFKPGNRNTPLVALCGFAIYKGFDNQTCIDSIENIDEETEVELLRVYDYAHKNNYGEFWKSKQAKKEYIF